MNISLREAITGSSFDGEAPADAYIGPCARCFGHPMVAIAKTFERLPCPECWPIQGQVSKGQEFQEWERHHYGDSSAIDPEDDESALSYQVRTWQRWTAKWKTLEEPLVWLGPSKGWSVGPPLGHAWGRAFLWRLVQGDPPELE